MSKISARCFYFFGNISATICKNLIFKFFHLVRKVFLICAKSDIKEHKELTTKRDKQVNLIATELKSLRDYEVTVNRTLTEIDRIEKSYKEAIIATDKYDFAKAFSLLESDITNMLLQSVGVDVSSLYNRYI